MYTPKTKEWFIERIGKRIFRDGQCLKNEKKCCETCKFVFENGLIVADENHAEYLSMIDVDFAVEGIFSNYRDNKSAGVKNCNGEDAIINKVEVIK